MSTVIPPIFWHLTYRHANIVEKTRLLVEKTFPTQETHSMSTVIPPIFTIRGMHIWRIHILDVPCSYISKSDTSLTRTSDVPIFTIRGMHIWRIHILDVPCSYISKSDTSLTRTSDYRICVYTLPPIFWHLTYRHADIEEKTLVLEEKTLF